MNIFQKIKSGMLISGAVLIVAGLVLLFFPVTTTKMIAYIAAAMLLFMGIGQVIGYFRYEPKIQQRTGAWNLSDDRRIADLL